MNIQFFTLGCKVNQYESEQIRKLLKTEFAEEDIQIVVVNSCTVTAESSRKSRQTVNRLRKENPEAVLVLTGCYPQAFPEEAYKTVADIVTGNRSNLKIPALIRQFLAEKIPVHAVENETDHCSYAEYPIDGFDGHTRAFVKIQDGCNRFCSYCIIPFARGRSRSRSLIETEKELRILAANGYKEIVLTGIDLSVYGSDIGCDLADAVGLSPQALSYHLAKLKKAGLIYETKEKNFIYYELDLTVLDEAIVWISTLKGEKNDEK